MNKLSDIPDSSWEALSNKKIYFGHQSVGFNIMDGIQDLMKENPKIKLNVVETNDGKSFNTGVFAHSRIGKNKEPDKKMAEFVDIINKEAGSNVDVAALKLCYVDFNSDTEIQKVFEDYVKAVETIKASHSNMKIIHFTVPLTENKTSWKTWIKQMLGKEDIWEFTDNVMRNKYNNLLKEKYTGTDPIFDIAGLESTYPSGKPCTFEYNGKTYNCMVPEYTYDGGHLNEVGRKIMAAELLLTLAKEV